MSTELKQEEVTDSMIREAFLANGFTIKDGHSDLKPYVYAAARAILALRPKRVPDDVMRDAERYRFIRDADVSDDLIPDIALYAMESLDEYIDAAMLAAK